MTARDPCRGDAAVGDATGLAAGAAGVRRPGPRPSVAAHDALARLVEYPREGFAWLARECARRVREECPAVGPRLDEFAAWAAATPLGELEEQFAQTFDNTDERALEVGWHVFGENYTRGTFMVDMRRRLREHGVEESRELPDHLGHVLALLGRLPPAEAAALAGDTARPAAAKVHEALERRGSPWTPVLAAVLVVLEADAAPSGGAAPRRNDRA